MAKKPNSKPSEEKKGETTEQPSPQIGDNQLARDKLRSYVERIERLEEGKQEYVDDIKIVKAEAKSDGFNTKALMYIVKQRKKKPSELEEDIAIRDLYMSAMGMAVEAPLFRHVGEMATDLHAREQVLNAFEALVPYEGEIIVKVGEPVRMYRTPDGEVVVEDYREPDAPAPTEQKVDKDLEPETKREVPDCTEDEAEEMGAKAYADDQPITANPFPWNDKRRQRFDKGYRKASGSDGMGPDTD